MKKLLIAAMTLLSISATAQIKISALPAATGATGNDELILNQSGVTKRVAVQYLPFVGGARTITINGVTNDLSANRSWTIPLVDTTLVATQNFVNNLLAGKVDIVAGKQLSTNDFTNTLLTKLNGIATGATANSSDATLLNRANHTGTQPLSTLSQSGATTGQVVAWNGTSYAPAAVASGGARFVPVIIFSGESNSGGQALNSELTSAEKLVRPHLQILNNLTMQLEPLHIGFNNTIGHDGPNGPIDQTVVHGWENGLAHSFENGMWGATDTGYLVKTGAGGCTVAQLESDGYFQYVVDRVTQIKNILEAQGKVPIYYLWYTQGINDELASNMNSAWKTASIAHLKRLRRYFGFAPTIMPYFMASHSVINPYLDTIAATVPFTYLIPTTGLGTQDTHHWNTSGMDSIAYRMVRLCQLIGQGDKYQLSQAYANSSLQPPVYWPGINYTPLVYSHLSGYRDGGGGALIRDANVDITNGGGGAEATVTFSKGDKWYILLDSAYTYDNNLTNGLSVALDASSTTDYTGSHVWKAAMQTYATTLYVGTNQDYTNLSQAGTPTKFLRWTNSSINDDLILEGSDNGTLWVTKYTHVNALAGTTTLYLRFQRLCCDPQRIVKAAIIHPAP